MTKENRWLLCCAALAAGEWCGFNIAPASALWPVMAVLSALVAMYGFGLSMRGWWLPFAFLAGVALAFYATSKSAEFVREAVEFNAGCPCDVELPVNSDAQVKPDRKGRNTISFKSGVGAMKLRVVVTSQELDELPRVGETWRCVGWLSDPIDGDPMRRIFWVRGEGTGVMRVRPAVDQWLRTVAARVKDSLSRRIGIGLGHDPQSAALNRAILLGERAQLDRTLKDNFAAAGTIHVFAISGLHVMVVARTLQTLLILMAVPVRLVGLVVIPLVWFYAYVIGMSPSALRASIMLTFLYAAPFGWRRHNGIVSWAAAFLLVHILSPESLLSIGSSLSFTVMLALVLYSRWRSRDNDDTYLMLDKFTFTCVAWAAGVPFVAAVFGRFTPAGLVANMAAVPIAGFAVAAGVLGIIASFLSDLLAMHLNNIAALAVTAMADISQFIASLPFVDFKIEQWTMVQCAFWYVALALVAWVVNRWRHRVRIVV